MTHSSPDRRWPRHRPRHGAAVRPGPPYRLRARRTARLLAAAASAAAGLCLVVGAVALVATVTALPSAAPVTAAARQNPTLRVPAGRAGRPPRRAHRPAAPASRVIAQFTGQGRPSTGRFRVSGDGTWQLQWSYDCSTLRHPGNFTVHEIDAGIRPATEISQTGRGGHGVTSGYPSAGPHYLAVNSGCAWKMRVLASR